MFQKISIPAVMRSVVKCEVKPQGSENHLEVETFLDVVVNSNLRIMFREFPTIPKFLKSIGMFV